MSSAILINQLRNVPANTLFPLAKDETVNQWLDRMELDDFKVPTVCALITKDQTPEEAEDCYLLRDEWDNPVPNDATIVFIPLPQGGGGGGSIGTILSVVLLVVAPYAAPLILGALGVAATATALAITAAVIVTVGSLVINSAFPPEIASINKSKSEDLQNSQSYNIAAQQNQVALTNPVALLYGRNRVVFKYASKPFNGYASHTYDQFLYLTLIVGVGLNHLPKVFMGGNLIAEAADGINLVTNDAFGDVFARVIPPNGTYMFDPEVTVSDTVTGIELLAPNEDTAINIFTTAAETLAAARVDLIAKKKTLEQAQSNASGYYDDDGYNGPSSAQTAAVTAAQAAYDAALIVRNNAHNAIAQIELPEETKGHIVCRSGLTVNKIYFDITSDGLILAKDDGSIDGLDIGMSFYARKINKEGDPVGSWFILGTVTMASVSLWYEEGATPNLKVSPPIILIDANGDRLHFENPAEADLEKGIVKNRSKTMQFNVPEGNYEAFAVRTNDKELSYKAQNTAKWVGLRGQAVQKIDNSNITLLQVAVRATSKINRSSVTTISGIVERQIKTITPTGISATEQFSDNAADCAYDILTNQIYGARNDPSSVSLDELRSIKNIAIARGDTFNLVIESAMDDRELLSLIMRTCRTVVWNSLGKWRFVRDQFSPIPIHVLTPQTIIGDPSLSLITNTADKPTLTTAEYFDADENTWKSVIGFEPSLQATNEIVNEIRLMGITNQAQAKRETISLVNVARTRRKKITVKVEHEGKLFDYLDPIGIVHEFFQKGQAQFAEYSEDSPQGLVIGCQDDFDWSSSEQYQAYIVKDVMGLSAPINVQQGDKPNEIIFTGVNLPEDLDEPIHIREGAENTQIILGTIGQLYTRCLVLKNTPIDLDTSTLTLVEDNVGTYQESADWLSTASWLSSITSSINSSTAVLTVNWLEAPLSLDGGDIDVKYYEVNVVYYAQNGDVLDARTVRTTNTLSANFYLGQSNSHTLEITVRIIGNDPDLYIPPAVTTRSNTLFVDPSNSAYLNWNNAVTITEDNANGTITFSWNSITGSAASTLFSWELDYEYFHDPDGSGNYLTSQTFTLSPDQTSYTIDVGYPYPEQFFKSWGVRVTPKFDPFNSSLGSANGSFPNTNYVGANGWSFDAVANYTVNGNGTKNVAISYNQHPTFDTDFRVTQYSNDPSLPSHPIETFGAPPYMNMSEDTDYLVIEYLRITSYTPFSYLVIETININTP